MDNLMNRLYCVALLTCCVSAWAVNNGDTPVNTPASARRMIEDLVRTHGDKYTGGKDFLKRLETVETKLKANAGDAEATRALVWAALGVTPYVDRAIELLDAAERGDPDHAMQSLRREVEILARTLGDLARAGGFDAYTLMMPA